MTEGNSGGKLFVMARAHDKESQSALPRNRRDTERAHETSKTRRHINKEKNGSSGRKGRQQQARTFKKITRNLCPNRPGERYHLHQPNGKFSNHYIKRV